ncbi:MAG: hypothetical protein PGN07_09050 [Aeromicrobium erythreum]
MTTPPATLTWLTALEHPGLLAPATAAVLDRWADVDPEAARRALVAEIDPALSDTAALTDAHGLDPDLSANCVVVSGRREGQERVAGLVVRATTRADVNGTVKRRLDVRKASFLPMERATTESGMEHGGITPRRAARRMGSARRCAHRRRWSGPAGLRHAALEAVDAGRGPRDAPRPRGRRRPGALSDPFVPSCGPRCGQVTRL